MADIIKNGWKVGVYIILSVQNALYGFKKAATLCQLKLCGGVCYEYNSEILLGTKNLPPIKTYEFLLSVNGSEGASDGKSDKPMFRSFVFALDLYPNTFVPFHSNKGGFLSYPL